MTTKNQRGVTINAAAYADFERAAATTGESVAAWLTRAGEQRRRRDSARAYAELMADPQVAAEVAAHDADISAHQQGSDRRLLAMDDAA